MLSSRKQRDNSRKRKKQNFRGNHSASEFCCTCLGKEQKLIKLSTDQGNESYDKLLVLVPQLDMNDIKDLVYVCDDCKLCIDNMFNFRNKCLSNNVVLREFIEQLRSSKSIKNIDLFLSNKLSNENTEFVDFEKKDIKVELESVDDRLTEDEERLINNDLLTVNIKQEIDEFDDDIHHEDLIVKSLEGSDPLSVNIKQEINEETSNELPDNNLTMNDPEDVEMDKNLEIKSDISSLHTEVNIEGDDGTHSNTEDDIESIPEQFEVETEMNTNQDDTSNNTSDYNRKIDNTEENTDLKQNKLPMCEVCNRIFRNPCSLKRHRRTHKKRPFTCVLCNITFKYFHLLQQHDKKHERINKQEKCITSKEKYLCDICGKLFPIRYKYIHRRIHADERPYVCNICNRRFRNSTNLKNHGKLHDDDKFVCKTCSKTFENLQNLQLHERYHIGIPYECEICKKSYKYKNQFRRHEMTHNDEKPYKCDVCDKSFKFPELLRKHKLIHSGEKPYKCEICGKSFLRAACLAIHHRTHTGEKPFRCDVCNKCFNINAHLKVHKRIHTGEKPYKCEMCDKSFKSANEFKRHNSIQRHIMK